MTAPQAGRKPVVGIIGQIGAGKSAVAAALARRGAAVIHADQVGHEVLARPEVIAELARWWGPAVLRANDAPNRREIAAKVFTDPHERQRLESLVFPLIGQKVRERLAAADANATARFVALDAAVMLEAGWGQVCDKLIYVDAPLAVRLERLATRSGWDAAELARREAAQMPSVDKAARADGAIHNDGSLAQLQVHVDELLDGWDLLPKDNVP